MRYQIWSSGGGVQSAAIAALIVSGKIAPPDLSLIIDTEREGSKTWEYMDAVITPALATVNVKLHRIAKSDFSTVDLYASGGDLLIPAYTDQNGEVGKLPTFCSNEWKQRAARRWVKTQTDATQFDVWLGISTDEMRRIKQVDGKWKNRYPLIEQRMNRGDCLAIVERMGWPAPPRSSCWMCPNKSAGEWIDLRENSPGDFSKAIKFENEIRQIDDGLWLTATGQPLSEFTVTKTPDLFTGRCDSGFCFT